MTDRKNGIIAVAVAMAVLSFLGIASAAGLIAIEDLWTEEERGFIEYRSMDDHNTSGNLTVYIDSAPAKEEQLDLHVIPFHGFLINRLQCLEYPLNLTLGLHNVSASIVSGNTSSNASCTYFCEATEEPATVLEPVDWLPCPSNGTANSHSHNYPFWVIPVPKFGRKFDNRIKVKGGEKDENAEV